MIEIVQYYDSVIFSLPVKLNTPKSMSIPDLYSLVNYLSTSPHPFTFHSKETILQQTGMEQPSLMPDVTESPAITNHQSDVEGPQKDINAPTDTSAIPEDLLMPNVTESPAITNDQSDVEGNISTEAKSRKPKPKTKTKSAATGNTERKIRSQSNATKAPSRVGLKRQAVDNTDIAGNVGKRRKRAC